MITKKFFGVNHFWNCLPLKILRGFTLCLLISGRKPRMNDCFLPQWVMESFLIVHRTICWVILEVAATSCKSTWDTVPYFGLNGLSMILCLWPPLHPFSKLLAIQDHAQNLEEQLWMGGRRGSLYILSHRPVTSCDLKQDRLFFRESVHNM